MNLAKFLGTPFLQNTFGRLLLNMLEKESGGLYTEDEIAKVNYSNGRRLDKLLKYIITLFKSEALTLNTIIT